MMEPQGENNGPSWEVFKENAQPLKRGRDTKKLSRALTARPAPFDDGAAGTSSSKPELTVKEFEATVTPEALVNDPDPLGVWIRYIHWMRQENPSSSTASTELMERCGRAFSHDPRYKNDERLVKVWIGYIDQQANPDEIFRYLHKNRIGSKVALFWVAWALVSEKAGKDKFVDEIFKKARKIGAAPEDVIVLRQKQFHRRLAKRLINSQTDDDSNATREPDSPQESRRRREEVQDENGGRMALGQMASTTASRMGNSRRGTSRGRRQQQQPAANEVRTTVVAGENNSAGFEIFADEQPHHGGYDLDAESTGVGQYSELAPKRERVKENVDIARKWNDPSVVASLKGRGRSPSTTRRGFDNTSAVATTGPAPAIFVEDEFKELPAHEDPGLKASSSNASGGLAIRQALDRPQTAAEVLLDDPLSFLKKDGGKSDVKNTAPAGKQEITQPLPQPSEHTPAPQPAQDTNGYDETLLTADAAGHETQFEERRAAMWSKKAAVVDVQHSENRPRSPKLQQVTVERTANPTAPAAKTTEDDLTINTATAFKEMQDIFGIDGPGASGGLWGADDALPAASEEPLRSLPPAPPMAYSSCAAAEPYIESSESSARCMPFALAEVQTTPPPVQRNPPPAVVIFDEMAASPDQTGQYDSGSQENHLMQPNPNRRTLYDVEEAAVLQPLAASAFGGGDENCEDDDEEGPMPEEAEIYRHMQGLETDDAERAPAEAQPSALDFEIYCDAEDGHEPINAPLAKEVPIHHSPGFDGGDTGGRRETADPNALMAMLAAFQEEDDGN